MGESCLVTTAFIVEGGYRKVWLASAAVWLGGEGQLCGGCRRALSIAV